MDPIDKLILANEHLIDVNKALIDEYRKIRRYVVFGVAVLLTAGMIAATTVVANSRRLAGRIVQTIITRQQLVLEALHDEAWCPTSTVTRPPPPPLELPKELQ